jgi:hypothetical protein
MPGADGSEKHAQCCVRKVWSRHDNHLGYEARSEIGAQPTFTERRLNDRYVNSYWTSAWRQPNVEDAP